MTSEHCSNQFKVIRKAKRIWTEEEDSRLLMTLESESLLKNKVKWIEIASTFKDKSSKQCYNRYRHINPSLQRGYWTKDEEEKLMSLINLYGKKWAKISQILVTRSGKQIRHHYVNILDKLNKKSKFSLEENNKLINLFNKYGAKWQKISEEFVGRSADNLKCRYYNIIKQKTNKKTKALLCNNINNQNDFNTAIKATSSNSIISTHIKTTEISSSEEISDLKVFPIKTEYLEDKVYIQGLNVNAAENKTSYFKNFNFLFNNKSNPPIDKLYNVNSKMYNVGFTEDKNQKDNLSVIDYHENGNS